MNTHDYTWKHFSSEPSIELQPLRAISGNLDSKPIFAFWLSYGDAWKEWCEQERFGTSKLQYEYHADIASHARVLFMNDHSELKDFGDRYDSGIRNEMFGRERLDWNAVAQDYDVVAIAPYVYVARYCYDCNWYYHWDVASAVVLNTDVVRVVRV